MDDQLLLHLYHRFFDDASAAARGRYVYGDGIVMLIYFLAVIRDRSPRWAWHRHNWPLWMRRLACPSYSQLLRRLKSASVQQRLMTLNRELRERLPQSKHKFCDGKPLVTGGFSKDPDGAAGVLPGNGWGRGYKVHVIVDACGAVDVFAVTSLAGGEPPSCASWSNASISTP
jgi:hypothetical protein